ncbi:hypothetical protein IH979_01800 [Patescibacteria group bacterium]|nr:hypothetical protein [Patescibacteria group bacterium]
MKSWGIGARCLIFVSVTMACRGENETIDIVEGTYQGYFKDGELEERVTDVSDSARLIIDFYEFDVYQETCLETRELWADIAFHGTITIGGVPLIGKVELDGPDKTTIEGVTVDGLDLICVPCRLFGYYRDVYGTFSQDFLLLEITSDGIGMVPLDFVE